MSEYSDRDRLDWLSRLCAETDIWIVHDGVERGPENFYRVTVDDGPNVFHGKSARDAVDAAMRSAGIKPQPQQTVSMVELRTIFEDAIGNCHGPELGTAIRAVLKAAEGKRVTE